MDSLNGILEIHMGDYNYANSNEKCITACKAYQYAGTTNGYQCFCGNDKPHPDQSCPGAGVFW